MYIPQPQPTGSPAFSLLATEPVRAAFEFVDHHFRKRTHVPTGDGHSVIIFPGLGTNEWVTRPLQTECERLGYQATHWGRGFNVGPDGQVLSWLDDLASDISKLGPSGENSLSLIGWSLGGIYAREVAKRLGSRVRQVITIGSPIAGTASHTNGELIYRILNGKKPPDDNEILRSLQVPPSVPTTSIFSKGDGIVAWDICLNSERRRDIENIEVSGSHCGMCWNSEIHQVIANRLSQRPGKWRPYHANKDRN